MNRSLFIFRLRRLFENWSSFKNCSNLESYFDTNHKN